MMCNHCLLVSLFSEREPPKASWGVARCESPTRKPCVVLGIQAPPTGHLPELGYGCRCDFVRGKMSANSVGKGRGRVSRGRGHGRGGGVAGEEERWRRSGSHPGSSASSWLLKGRVKNQGPLEDSGPGSLSPFNPRGQPKSSSIAHICH